jgi:hypothetical protein
MYVGNPEGTELPDEEAARKHASQVAHDLAGKAPFMRGGPHGWDLIVTDENKRHVMTITMPRSVASKLRAHFQQ